jgi:hypothetical protein
MIVIHRVFRREFGLAPAQVRNVAVGDRTRSAAVSSHITDLLAGLHHHHEGEDLLLWPRLLARASLHSDLIHRMESQHHALSAALDDVELAVRAWAANAGRADRDRLATALDKVGPLLVEHLGEEEREILPLVRKHLTSSEYRQLGERGSEMFKDRSKLLLFLGMILEEASPQEQTAFLSELPPPARLMWRLLGRRRYAAYVKSMRIA